MWKWSSAAALVLLPAWAAASEWQRYEAVEPHMGTLVRITLYARGEDVARRAFQVAFGEIRRLDAICSDYRADSEINRLPYGEAVRVSEDLWNVLRVAQQVARASGGAFDVTAGAVTRVWREARRTGRLPDAEAIRAARAVSGYELLRLERGKVTLLRRGMRLDLGGIAKGYAAQAALRRLRREGIARALVAVSGDLAIGDAPPGERGWRVRVEPNAGSERTLVLRQRCVSTSGDREQFVVIGGVRYSHIVDPRSGEALRDQRGITVIGSNGAMVDAWAKVICVREGANIPRQLLVLH